jgi:hypothetical protein
VRVLVWLVAGFVMLVLLYVVGMTLAMAFGPADSYLAWVSWRVEATQRIGDSIVRQLDACRQRTGRYPSSLKELVPEYMGAIPAPSVGRGWIYRSDGKTFMLEFAVGNYEYPNSRFYSENARWYTDE